MAVIGSHMHDVDKRPTPHPYIALDKALGYNFAIVQEANP
jgi:hypothetical protein